MSLPDDLIKQHLIDPELCIRCDTCETSCPSEAITHDTRNYVVNADLCNGCLDCIAGCPTGAIDNWRMVSRSEAYSITEQFTWDLLPAPTHARSTEPAPAAPACTGHSAPASAPAPAENVYTRETPLRAVVVENRRLTPATSSSDIRHIVLETAGDFRCAEGQSIGVIPPGVDASGRRLIMRLYSVASPRTGEDGERTHVAVTVKRVLEDHAGKPHHGLCSNHVCDLQPGEMAEVTGPHGSNFLMPDDPAATLLMICTGTGIAPMRAMLAQRLRLADTLTGRQMLFYGGRTPEDLPYHHDLLALPQGFLDLNLAFSRIPDRPRKYVQDALRERAGLIADCLKDENCYVYLCGLKGMETGVDEAFEAICHYHGMDWRGLAARLKQSGRLHVETY